MQIILYLFTGVGEFFIPFFLFFFLRKNHYRCTRVKITILIFLFIVNICVGLDIQVVLLDQLIDPSIKSDKIFSITKRRVNRFFK